MPFSTAPAPAVRTYTDPDQAIARIDEIYGEQIRFLTERFRLFAEGDDPPERVRGFYPYVEMTSRTAAQLDSRLAYGFVPAPGTYRATLTRPDLFGEYYREQFELLLKNHGGPLAVGLSSRPIPIHFALARESFVEATLDSRQQAVLGDYFDLPDG